MALVSFYLLRRFKWCCAPIRHIFHPSHFGPRYNLGCCGNASLSQGITCFLHDSRRGGIFIFLRWLLPSNSLGPVRLGGSGFNLLRERTGMGLHLVSFFLARGQKRTNPAQTAFGFETAHGSKIGHSC